MVLGVRATGEDAGDHVVEGRGEDGRLLFSRRFSLTALDHDPTTHSFAVAVPIDDALMNMLESVTVRGPGGSASRLRSRQRDDDAPAGRRTAEGTSFTCPSGTAAALVQEPGSERVLASATGSEVRLPSASSAPVRLSCSDGIRTRSAIILPR
jgi:hypothetical protein